MQELIKTFRRTKLDSWMHAPVPKTGRDKKGSNYEATKRGQREEWRVGGEEGRSGRVGAQTSARSQARGLEVRYPEASADVARNRTNMGREREIWRAYV